MTIHSSLSRQNNNIPYIKYGSFSRLNNAYGSIVIDNDNTNKALPNGPFFFNNTKPIYSRGTSSLATIYNMAISNMGGIHYPRFYYGQPQFGNPDYSYFLLSPFGNRFRFFYGPQRDLFISRNLPKTYYYYSSSNDKSWTDTNNWYTDSDLTQKATNLPNKSDTVVITSDVVLPSYLEFFIDTHNFNLPVGFEINIPDTANRTASYEIKAGSVGDMIDGSTIVFRNTDPTQFVSFSRIGDTDDFILYNVSIPNFINSTPFQISFDSPKIDPNKNPVLLHVRYDENSQDTIYEDITTQVVNGQISGTVTSLGLFVIITEITEPQILETFSITSNKASQTFSTQGWAGPMPQQNCSFTLNLQPPEPCPGNQTRGNWVIENGIPTPRLLATKCDCYEPSFITVDMVMALAGSIGAARALVCAGWKKIASLGIPQLLQEISDYMVELRNILNTLTDLKSRLLELQEMLTWPGIDIKSIEQEMSITRMMIMVEGGAEHTTRGLLTNRKAALAAAEGAQASILVSINKALLDGLSSMALMYSFVNEISVKKVCPPGQTLNPLTCECCPNCTGGKVFPDPMNGCDCSCPPDKIPCLSVNDDGCYDPCPPGLIRRSPDCSQCVPIETPPPSYITTQSIHYIP